MNKRKNKVRREKERKEHIPIRTTQQCSKQYDVSESSKSKRESKRHSHWKKKKKKRKTVDHQKTKKKKKR